MPFDLINAPATFQRTTEGILSELNNKNILVYLDDIIICSVSQENHLIDLKPVFEAKNKANLKIKFDNCQFFSEKIKYLGFLVSNEGFLPDPGKIEVIKNLKTPKNKKNSKCFLVWQRIIVSL